jgi:hypothetical protein
MAATATIARPPSGTSSHGSGVVIRRGLDRKGKRSGCGKEDGVGGSRRRTGLAGIQARLS